MWKKGLIVVMLHDFCKYNIFKKTMLVTKGKDMICGCVCVGVHKCYLV
jgi:hypothetical protein